MSGEVVGAGKIIYGETYTEVEYTEKAHNEGAGHAVWTLRFLRRESAVGIWTSDGEIEGR